VGGTHKKEVQGPLALRKPMRPAVLSTLPHQTTRVLGSHNAGGLGCLRWGLVGGTLLSV
jgi:hypothetical protein